MFLWKMMTNPCISLWEPSKNTNPTFSSNNNENGKSRSSSMCGSEYFLSWKCEKRFWVHIIAPCKMKCWHIIIPMLPLEYLLHAICDMGINWWSKNLKSYYIIINCLVDTGSKFAIKVNKDFKYWPWKYPDNIFFSFCPI